MPARRLLNLAITLLLSTLTLALAGVVLDPSRAAPLADSTPPPEVRIEPAVRRFGGIRPPAPAADVGIASIDAQGTVTITTEGFEGAFPTGLWDVPAPPAGYNPNNWGPSACQKRSGLKSAWIEGAANPPVLCGTNYVISEFSWMIYGPFDLSNALSAQLRFSYRITSELNFDVLFWGSSIDGFDFSGFQVSGNSGGWIDQSFDLANRVGQPNVWIGFLWESDYSITRPEGAYIDDVVITKTVPVPNLVPQKAVDRAQVEAGETLTYTISVHNNGTANAPGTRLTDTLPFSMSLLGGSLTANSGSVGASSQVITWAGAIAVSQTVRITYSVVLTNNIPGGTTLVNPVVVDDGAGALYNTQASVLIGAFTYLPSIVRNFCGGVTIDDPGFASQPDMVQINADDAWRQCVLGDPGIVVAIIDSGAALSHTDLVANLIPGYDYVDNDAVPEDGNGHGTNVAGIAGAALNGVGVIGVAPNTHLLPVRVLNNSGQGTLSQVASGISYAADRAHILNLSLSTISLNSTLQSAIAYAVNTKGRLVVAAAGNCGDPATFLLNGCDFVDQPNYPAAYSSSFPNVMAVAAVNGFDQQASFSNEGAYVTIAAPGVGIYNTYTSPQYKSVSGTSQAAPHVAGLAALIWARNPAYNAAQVRTAIETTADDLGSPSRDNQYGWGRIDVFSAVGLSSAALAAGAETSTAGVELPPPPDNRDAEFVPGRVLTKFKLGVSAASIDQTLSAFDGVSVEGQIGQLGILMLRVPAGQEWQLIDQLRALPDVEFAEPDTIIRLHPDPSSP